MENVKRGMKCQIGVSFPFFMSLRNNSYFSVFRILSLNLLFSHHAPQKNKTIICAVKMRMNILNG